MNAVIYARGSSTGDRQSTERQVMDLTDYATKNDITIQQPFEEHMSGAKRNSERPVLTECLDYCRGNDTDILLVSELSRLGRNVDAVLSSICWCKNTKFFDYFLYISIIFPYFVQWLRIMSSIGIWLIFIVKMR